MPNLMISRAVPMDPAKFQDPLVTAKGEERAVVALTRLHTVWFNTGSLCNITCKNCYMDSSPTNDNLEYLSLSHVVTYLDEIAVGGYPVEEIAFTGGEPFMNKDLPAMIEESLTRGFRVLVLTNAMRPLHHRREDLLAMRECHGDALTIRVSIDHFTQNKHEDIRGTRTWEPMIKGLRWLAANGFNLNVAGRTCWDETENEARIGYRAFFQSEDINIDADDPARLVLFPEMDMAVDVPEITVHCWDILGIKPETIMCATSRMIVSKKGADGTVVVPCTLLPFDEEFELGADLSQSAGGIRLNHPHCAKFCVLGGASCSPD
ncbi:MAG: radical SAM protein [Alphaproteobacteria bacterium]|nr:radical SAM protein [Alphaproteobacteria bacterium]